jgi:hypothetical protein
MHEQTELFPPLDFVDYSIGMISKSTKRKKRPSRKLDRFFNARKSLKMELPKS